MRVGAVDFGGARIGRAVGDSGAAVSTPRPNLPASGTLARDAEALCAWAKEDECDRLVVGLALQPDGTETRMSKVCRRLGDLISGHGIEVVFVDEAMTSAEAEAAMLDAGLKGSQRRRASDGEAACRILERYWQGGAGG